MAVSGSKMVDIIVIDSDEESLGAEGNQFPEEWMTPRPQNPKFDIVLDAQDWNYRLNFPVSFIREHLADITKRTEVVVNVSEYYRRMAHLVNHVPILDKNGENVVRVRFQKNLVNCLKRSNLFRGDTVEIQLTHRDDLNNLFFLYITRQDFVGED